MGKRIKKSFNSLDCENKEIFPQGLTKKPFFFFLLPKRGGKNNHLSPRLNKGLLSFLKNKIFKNSTYDPGFLALFAFEGCGEQRFCGIGRTYKTLPPSWQLL